MSTLKELGTVADQTKGEPNLFFYDGVTSGSTRLCKIDVDVAY